MGVQEGQALVSVQRADERICDRRAQNLGRFGRPAIQAERIRQRSGHGAHSAASSRSTGRPTHGKLTPASDLPHQPSHEGGLPDALAASKQDHPALGVAHSFQRGQGPGQGQGG